MAIVTIILPNFNHANFLQKRLSSIENQTFLDWKIIIIDDCSSDESIAILQQFADRNNSKIAHFIINDTNSGSGYSSWQKGIELAQTKYIWIAETDDYAENTFLETQINLLEQNSTAALAFCNSQYVDELGHFLYTSQNRTKDLISFETSFSKIDATILLEKMPIDTYITNASSVIFRKPIELIPENIFNHKQCSDIFLWTYLIQKKTIIFNSEILNYFRQHKNSTTTLNYKANLKEVYLEKFEYLKNFKQQSKVKLLLDDYIRKYVIFNKKEWFTNSLFKRFHFSYSLKIFYYSRLFRILIHKLW